VQAVVTDRRLARTGIETAAIAVAGAGLVAGGVAVAKSSGTGRHRGAGADPSETPED